MHATKYTAHLERAAASRAVLPQKSRLQPCVCYCCASRLVHGSLLCALHTYKIILLVGLHVEQFCFLQAS